MKWWVNLNPRDRRALSILVLAAVLYFGVRPFMTSNTAGTANAINSIPLAESRLASLRVIAAGLPAKEAALKMVETDLDAREKSMVNATTSAQAGARLLEIARKVGSANQIEIRGGDLPVPKPFGDAYGEVFAGVSFTCRIDQLVNFFADLSREPDMVAPSEVQMATADPKQKTINVRMVLSGVVPRKMVPEKKGFGAL
jgi:hypothetical protein